MTVGVVVVLKNAILIITLISVTVSPPFFINVLLVSRLGIVSGDGAGSSLINYHAFQATKPETMHRVVNGGQLG